MSNIKIYVLEAYRFPSFFLKFLSFKRVYGQKKKLTLDISQPVAQNSGV